MVDNSQPYEVLITSIGKFDVDNSQPYEVVITMVKADG